MKTISLCLPSRGRPERAAHAIESIFAKASQPKAVKVLLGVDLDDPQYPQYHKLHMQLWPSVSLHAASRSTVNQVYDSLFDAAETDIVGFCADDQLIETQGWDEITRESVGDFGVWHVDRGIDLAVATNSFMSKAFEKRMRAAQGFVFAPFFPYWWGDTWLDEIAFMIGARTKMPWKFPFTCDTLTRGLRDMLFWQDYFTALRPRRVDCAVKLLGDESARPTVEKIAAHCSYTIDKSILGKSEASLAEPEPHPLYDKLKAEAEDELRRMRTLPETETKTETGGPDAFFDRLSAKKLIVVCMPLYDGKLSRQTWMALREEEQVFAALDLPWRFDAMVIEGCSLIAHARNELVAMAFQRAADAILWVDADMGWPPGAIARLVAYDVPIVAAAVPRRKVPIEWNVRPLEGTQPNERGLLEVESVGTGLMLTKRSVYETLAAHIGHGDRYLSITGETTPAYFQTAKTAGEDVMFCRRWRELGGKIWIDPNIDMEHVVAPHWSVRANYARWLEEQKRETSEPEYDPIAQCVHRLRIGDPSPETFVGLYQAWGNGVFAATPDLLAALYDLARQSKGPVLECGSGISTLVMAVANPDIEIHALEHDPSWLMRISRLLAAHGVTNVKLHIADMVRHDDGLFYDVSGLPEGPFGLVLLDGPPRHIGRRAIAYRVLKERMEGAVLAVDDTNDPHERLALAAYAKDRPGETGVYANDAKQFSIFIPGEAVQKSWTAEEYLRLMELDDALDLDRKVS